MEEKPAAFGNKDGGMCGIVGYLRKATSTDSRPVGAVALEMLRALSTRGPDSAGVAVYGAAGVDGDRRPTTDDLHPAISDPLRVRVKLGDEDPGLEVEAAVVAAARSVAPLAGEPVREGECLRLTLPSVEPARLEEAILRAVPGAGSRGLLSEAQFCREYLRTRPSR